MKTVNKFEDIQSLPMPDGVKAKLEQMGKNVFGLAQTDDLAEQTIQAFPLFGVQL